MKFFLLLLMAIAGLAAAADPAFDVASLKPSGGPGREEIKLNPGTLTMQNVSLHRCIQWAWEAPRLQISAPDWVRNERFDVSAKAAGAASTAEMRLMLRSLLAERLGVQVHEEKRELPVYYLTVARSGPRLHEASAKDQSKFVEVTTEGLPQFGRNRVLMTAGHVTMGDLADQLSEPLRRPVIDRTGLKARYDLILDPTAYMVEPEGDGPKDRVDPISMILTAIPAQLGLKVEAGKDTVPFWVVDAANKTPSGN